MRQISEATAKIVNGLLMGRSWKVKGKLRNEKLWDQVLYTLKVIMKETIFESKQTGRPKYRVCSCRKVQWETFGLTMRWSSSKFSSKFSCADYCLRFLWQAADVCHFNIQ